MSDEIKTLAAYAAARGWTPETLQVKIKRGTITDRALVKNGSRNVGIIPKLADEDLAKNGNPFLAEARALKMGKQNPSPAPAAEDDDWLGEELAADVLPETKPAEIPKAKKEKRKIDGQDVEATVLPPSAGDQMERFRGAKTSKEELSARKLELEVAEIEGRLLDTEGVKKRIQKRVSETKDQLSNLAGKLAPILVGITDVVEMETTLQKEINAACQSIFQLGQTKWNEKEE